MPVMRLLLLITLMDMIASAAAVTVVSLTATKDTTLDGSEGDKTFNSGRNPNLFVGHAQGFGPYRSLLFFPLAELSKHGKLLKAYIKLSLNVVDPFHIRCTSDPHSAGCTTVHLLQTTWDEGANFLGDATVGEASWIHNSYPSAWDSPGGDYDPSPIGKRSPESEVESSDDFVRKKNFFAEFALDVNVVSGIISGESPYYGFLLKDDEDPGGVSFESRECVFSSHASCLNNAGPELVLEFEEGSQESTGSGNADNVAAIAGGVVGGVASVLLLGLIWLWSCRSESKASTVIQKEASPSHTEPSNTGTVEQDDFEPPLQAQEKNTSIC